MGSPARRGEGEVPFSYVVGRFLATYPSRKGIVFQRPLGKKKNLRVGGVDQNRIIESKGLGIFKNKTCIKCIKARIIFPFLWLI